MTLVNRKALVKATKKNHQLRKAVLSWELIAEAATWHSIVDLRQSFPTADFLKGTNVTCFDILGGGFRLMTFVSYTRQEINIIELLTHAEYDRKY
jgi:mRNA interferase HigB